MEFGLTLFTSDRGIRPTTATLEPGQSQNFMAEATWCGDNDDVVYRLTGPGTLDSLTGRYTATTPGTATSCAGARPGTRSSFASTYWAAFSAAPTHWSML